MFQIAPQLVGQGVQMEHITRRIGELIRMEFTIRFSLREAPEVALQNPTPMPQGAVIGESGDETTVVETS